MSSSFQYNFDLHWQFIEGLTGLYLGLGLRLLDRLNDYEEIGVVRAELSELWNSFEISYLLRSGRSMTDNWGKAGGKALVLGAAKQETEEEK